MLTRNIIQFIILLFLLFSCSSKGSENFDDLSKIEIGMDINSAHQAMRNEPVDIDVAYWDNNLLVERYESGIAASDYYSIVYQKSDSSVVEIGWGD